ncbi:thioredoxin domain-containing protein 5 homolog [Uranotaenia lowii]|uniref:thioredoxin domain-containing protein 5 homolog n=1 Tax=Uranotaenia lowii TaxID=190385 RepID=UPI0024788EE4|nr:thioredoxin domain-containing protein 5 homolog [Uranotaenia lowii]
MVRRPIVVHLGSITAILLVILTSGIRFSEPSSLNNFRLQVLDQSDEFNGINLSQRLTARNFAKQLNTSQNFLVLFYLPWCEYCLKLLPIWEDLANMIEQQAIPQKLLHIGHMDCIAEEEFCAQLKVGECPEVRAYKRDAPEGYEIVYPSDLEDTVEYLQEYVLNPEEDSPSFGFR